MKQNNQTNITKDLANKKVMVTREFDAPVELVWKAWTESKILDQWWAPKPWKAKTKSMDFREGGTWFYSMVGPNGEESHCRADFKKIVPNKNYSGDDAFCDENGKILSDPPGMFWDVTFNPSGSGTRVDVVITFKTEEDLKKIMEMGFQEGFTAAHGNLDELLAKQSVK